MQDDAPKAVAETDATAAAQPKPKAASAKSPAPETERIAKHMARVGIASRRDAEKMILAGRVAVNGDKIASPALDVGPRDRITLDGKPIEAKQPTRMWLYYKPLGLVVSDRDEKGRQTIYDTLPEGMPRVMSIGRLDLTSEGLLLLTNDGELKRRLELPTTGWLRKYRVRVNGQPNDMAFDPLRRGITIDGEDFQPMEIALDRQQGANAWLTVGIREGKNREIRRAMGEVGLTVNRLIRLSYGPFRLNEMKPGDLIEVRAKIMRDQLGPLMPGQEDMEPRSRPDYLSRNGDGRAFPRPRLPRVESEDEGARKPRKPRAGRDEGFAPREDRGDRDGWKPREDRGERGPREGWKPREDRGDRGPRDGWKPREDRGDRGPREGWKPREDRGERGPREGWKPREDRGERGPREGWKPREDRGERDDRGGFKPRGAGFGPRSAAGSKPGFKSSGFKSHGGDRPERGERPYGERPERSGGERFERPNRGPRGEGDDRGGFKPRGEGFKPQGDRPFRGPRGEGDDRGGFKPRSAGFKSHGGPAGGKPRAAGFKSHGDRPQGDRPYSDRPREDRPRADRPRDDRPRDDRPREDRNAGGRSFGAKSFGAKPYGDKPKGDRPFGDRPKGDRPRGKPGFGGKSFGAKPGGKPQGGRPPRKP